jgi:signal peptidase I
MFTIFLYLVAFVVFQFILALGLWLGARLAKVGSVSYLRALGAVYLAFALVLVLNIVLVIGLRDLPPLIVSLVSLAINLVGTWLVIQWVLRTSFGKAVLAWLPMLGAIVFNLALVFFVIKPFMVEAFVTANMSMAPTLVSVHRVEMCPHCGEHALMVSVIVVPELRGLRVDDTLGICASCMKTATVQAASAPEQPADRFMANKLLALHRWDLAVLRSPENPDTLLVKRIVGLPGEHLEIKDGKIWINGLNMETPPQIAGLEFIAELDGIPEKPWGSPENPARLEPDEYFVIGDFGPRSSDSRMWGRGVPRSAIVGVATIIYWPPNRWRILR